LLADADPCNPVLYDTLFSEPSHEQVLPYTESNDANSALQDDSWWDCPDDSTGMWFLTCSFKPPIFTFIYLKIGLAIIEALGGSNSDDALWEAQESSNPPNSEDQIMTFEVFDEV
jgi:hypothetical protein